MVTENLQDNSLRSFEEKTKELKKINERLSIIIEAAPNGLVMVDKQGAIVLCNSEVETLFGYSREEIIGQKIEILVPDKYKHHHPAHRDTFAANPATRKMGAGRDLYGRRKDKAEFPIEIGLSPLELDHEVYVIASVVDITQRKQLEEKERRSAQALREKTQEMEQFLYTVSHDLKSPLVTSTGFLGLLKEDIVAGRTENLMDSITRLERANLRMGQLTDDLLQLSRVGRISLTIQPIEVQPIITAIIENLSDRINEQGVTIDVQHGLPVIEADAQRVYQVFENLIINAMKYACHGDDRSIFIGFQIGADEILFFVRDHGPGIPSQYQQKVFGLFQRLESDNRGTGVGLTIVDRIMQVHGGRVWIDSDVGQGATFWLAFARQPAKHGGKA